jgi:hypothetical protein
MRNARSVGLALADTLLCAPQCGGKISAALAQYPLRALSRKTARLLRIAHARSYEGSARSTGEKHVFSAVASGGPGRDGSGTADARGLAWHLPRLAVAAGSRLLEDRPGDRKLCPLLFQQPHKIVGVPQTLDLPPCQNHDLSTLR